MSCKSEYPNLSDNDTGMEAGKAEEDNKNINDPTTRLSRLERPTVGKRPKKRRMREPVMVATKPAKTKTKGAGNGRNLGKLAQLIDMPLDVFFEIVAQLEPLDILQLSRVSKQFRSTFSSKHSRHIWIAARRNISMPECPPDLTEMQYASLMFEQICQACGSRAYNVDWSLRLRFCGPCFEANVHTGSKVMKSHHVLAGLPDLIFTLLPRSSLQCTSNYLAGAQGILSGISDGDSKINGQHNAYYVPEIEMVIKQYQAYKAEPIALGRFVEQKQSMASQMMKNARVLTEWVKIRKKQKAADKAQKALESMANREASIEAKLFELGWEKREFPSEWDPDWRALVKQPRKLTPHVWNIIHPKLVAILECHKQITILSRRDQREREFKPLWDEFVISHSWDVEKSWAKPTFVDACELPVINKMLAEDEWTIQVTAERWQAVAGSVPDELVKFADQIMRDVIKLLKAVNSETNSPNDIATAVDNEEVDPSIFGWASSLLSCGVSGCKNLLTFPEILQEEHLTPCPYLKWSDLFSSLRHEPEVFRTVSLVLKTLELPDDTPLVAFDAFDRKLICMCDNPKFRGPMDFRSLIRHLADENTTYESQVQTRRHTSYARELVLHNDHDLTRPEPRISLLSFADLATLTNTGDEHRIPTSSSLSNALVSPSYFETRYCKDCWILNLTCHTMRDDEEVAYHMKAKHLRQAGEQDAPTFWELDKWKRKHPYH